MHDHLRRSALPLLAALLLLALAPSAAQAQNNDEPTPDAGAPAIDGAIDASEGGAQGISRGLTLPFPTIVDREDALSLELNPAGLAHMQGFELVVANAHLEDDKNDGIGVLVGVPIVSGLAVGLGHQIIDAGLGGKRYTKSTFGFGVGGPVALGFNYNFYGSDTYRELDNLSSWDVGFQFRPFSWLGLAANIRDADTPFLTDDAVLQPSLDAGLALRFFDGRLLVESNATFQDGTKTVIPRFMGLVEPYEGIRLYGQITTDTGEDGDSFNFAEATAGLELNFAYFGASGAGILDEDTGGYSAYLRFSGVAYRSPAPDPERFYRVKMGGSLTERAAVDIFGRSSGSSFLGVMQRLEEMHDDPSVEGLVLELEGIGLGYAQLWELRKMLERFKERDVTIIAYLNSTGYREYYLASLADYVAMGPSGTFNARGVLAQQAYYRAALDKLGVEPDFVKIGDYKTAPESFTREAPTEENEEALNAYLDTLYKLQVSAIAASRELEEDRVKDLIDEGPHTPQDARDAGLVDAVFYPDELEDMIKEKYGKGVSISDRYGRRERNYDWGTDPTIAVIYIDGAIVTGSSGANPILGSTLTGAKTIEEVAEWAKKSNSVSAVVLRVDSPGGSAVASDLIYRALKQLGDKKPVIVSMGDIAASGGYYVAAAGETILCSPTTLTGSIGIYSGKFALDGLFDKIGYNQVTYKRGDNANLYSLEEPWSESEREEIYKQISYLYDLFLQQVAEGRGMTKDEVNEVGQGRIWSGVEAKKVNLCDEHGGLLDAIAMAKDRAGLAEDEDIRVLPLPRSSIFSPITPGLGINVGQIDIASLTGGLVPNVAEGATFEETWEAYGPLRRLLEPVRPALELALTYADGEGLAMLPFTIKWR